MGSLQIVKSIKLSTTGHVLASLDTPKYGFQPGLPNYPKSEYDCGDDCDSLKSFPSNVTYINILSGISTDSPINKIEYNRSSFSSLDTPKSGFQPELPNFGKMSMIVVMIVIL